MINWKEINKELPEIIFKEDGCVNCVLTKAHPDYRIDGGSEYQVSNTVFINKYPDHFTHWAYIDEPK